MAGIIDNFIDWATPKISKLFNGAAEFIQTTPKYISNTDINSMFGKEMKANTAEMIKKYGSNLGLSDEALESFTYNDFSKLSKNQRGEILQNYRKEMSGVVRNKNAFNALDYDNFDPGSQKHLDSVYRTMNSSEFKEAYMQHQIDLGKKGMFGKEFNNFDFSDGGKNLNKEQLGALSDYFDSEYGNKVANFQEKYLPTGVVENGPQQRLNYNLGLQKRYLGTKQGSAQLEMAHGLGGKKGESIIDAAIRKNASDADTLNAYRSHLNKHLVETPDIKGKWEAPQSFEQWATEQGMKDSEIKRISKELASGDPDHSGIGLWGLIKDHPRISTAMAVGTAWGISELTEE